MNDFNRILGYIGQNVCTLRETNMGGQRRAGQPNLFRSTAPSLEPRKRVCITIFRESGLKVDALSGDVIKYCALKDLCVVLFFTSHHETGCACTDSIPRG